MKTFFELRESLETVNEAKQTHMFDNEKDARAKAKEIGGKYVKGIGKSNGKHAAIKEEVELEELTAAEKKLVDKMYDKKGNLTPFGKKVMGHKFPTNTSATQGKRMGVEGKAANPAQQAAIAIAKKEKESVDESKKMDSDALKRAMDAFKKRGGKVKKVAPGRAAGWHGKDDLGTDTHGMIAKNDTRKMGTRKKVRSMEDTQVDEISRNTKKSYIKKAADDMSKQADRMARSQRGDGKMDKAANKFVNRRKGIARAVENFQVQKYTNGKKDGPAKSFGGDLKKATAHADKMGGDHRVHKVK